MIIRSAFAGHLRSYQIRQAHKARARKVDYLAGNARRLYILIVPCLRWVGGGTFVIIIMEASRLDKGSINIPHRDYIILFSLGMKKKII
jgi:hypothetical protein